MHNADILRPTHVEINLSRLTDNLHAIRQHVGNTRIMAVIKANGYGHGMVPLAHHYERLGVDYFGVAFLEEGIMLRQQGITTPILVLGGILGAQIPRFIEHDLTLTASSVEKLAQIETAAAQLGKRATVHLKIDTGMERIGVHYYSAEPLIAAALACNHCDIEGLYSHFANADAEDLSSAHEQLARFTAVLTQCADMGLHIPLRHIANSGAILQLPESYFDMVRPGIMLYGVYPSAEVRHTIPLKPALTWKTQIVYFKVVKPGHPVSYGSTWKTNHMVRVVTLPVGYGDGYFRRLSNKGQVLLNGRRYPIIGRVCMDQTMINIEWDSAYNGDPVILLGASGTEAITCEEMAEWAGTIPYEILTNINTRVPRIYVGGELATGTS